MTQAELRAEALATDAVAAIDSGSTLSKALLAIEIKTFLASNRYDIPVWRQDELDTAFERLSGNGPGASEEEQSSLWSGITSYWKDPNKIDPKGAGGMLGGSISEGLNEALKKLLATTGGKVAVVVTVAVLAAYFWRAVK